MVRLLSVVEIKLILSFLSEIVRLLSEDFLIIWLHLLLVYPPKVLFSGASRNPNFYLILGRLQLLLNFLEFYLFYRGQLLLLI